MSEQEQHILAPTNIEEVQQCIQAAISRQESLEVVGCATKHQYGLPVQARQRLTLARMNQVLDYQPHELILVVQPGAPLAEVRKTLSDSGQTLAFDPPAWGQDATIGGTIGANLSGPGRIKGGAARDHLLGFHAVTGRGDIIRGGGRVVKNVTGYDLSKAMTGSFGTLAVMTELVLKVLPAPEMERTVVVPGLDEQAAMRLMLDAARSPHDPSALAHLLPGVQIPEVVRELATQDTGLTLIRVEGPEPSVMHRSEAMQQLTDHQVAYLTESDSSKLWENLRELRPLPVNETVNLWRISIPPALATQLWKELRILGAEQGFMDWGGGLVWALLPTARRGTRLHQVAREAGGHARLVRFGRGEHTGEQVFSPLDSVKATLHKNLKLAFDPTGVLNPGRMYPEI